MMVYSLSLCFMPQYDCCVFNAGPREGGALGPFAGLFQSLTALASRSVVHSGFCLVSLGFFFVSPGRNLFGFVLCFSWTWRGCSSNPSAAFRGELDSSVLVQDQ